MVPTLLVTLVKSKREISKSNCADSSATLLSDLKPELRDLWSTINWANTIPLLSVVQMSQFYQHSCNSRRTKLTIKIRKAAAMSQSRTNITLHSMAKGSLSTQHLKKDGTVK